MQSLPDARALAHPFSVTCHGYSPQNVVTKQPICADVSPVSKGRNAHYDEPKAKAAPSAEAAGDGVPGLVSSQTSGTPCAEVLRVDREVSRLRRLRSSVLTAARLHVQQRPRWRVAMLTLTYADARGWRPDQISVLVRHVRNWLKRRKVALRYVWVQEFCKKDARPHYHMLVWLPLGLTLPKPDKQGWWRQGTTRREWARNAVGYIAKYASKGDSLAQPAKGARMHGNGGLTEDALLEQRWWKLPTWIRSGVEPSDRVRRAPCGTGGGFVHPDTGEVYRSPWGVFFKGGYVWIYRKAVV